eukprot:scaffold11_cov257-Pinguiococcus_pyrenoidosus.AAC.65
MAFLCSKIHRGLFHVRADVWIGVVGEERANHCQVTSLCALVQRRQPLSVLAINVCALLEKKLRDFVEVLPRSDLERLTRVFAEAVGIRAVSE